MLWFMRSKSIYAYVFGPVLLADKSGLFFALFSMKSSESSTPAGFPGELFLFFVGETTFGLSFWMYVLLDFDLETATDLLRDL